jgi:hypothetical protein
MQFQGEAKFVIIDASTSFILKTMVERRPDRGDLT